MKVTEGAELPNPSQIKLSFKPIFILQLSVISETWFDLVGFNWLCLIFYCSYALFMTIILLYFTVCSFVSAISKELYRKSWYCMLAAWTY